MRRFIALYISLLCAFVGCLSAERPALVFTPVDARQGLSANQVRNITQLPDGRMMFTTAGQMNIYDGTGFTYLHYTPVHVSPLSGYTGFHHDYVDANGYVWMKNQHMLMAVDLVHERMLEHPDSLLRTWGLDEPLNDLFMDRRKDLWLVTAGDRLLRVDHRSLQTVHVLDGISAFSGQPEDLLLDLDASDKLLFLFYRSGQMLCYDYVRKEMVYRQYLSDVLPQGWYGSTSFVVPTAGGFYQLCNGQAGGAMLYYDNRSLNCEVVLRLPYAINYLSLDSRGNAWVSCLEGLWTISADRSRKQWLPVLKLLDGRTIETEVSTLYCDKQDGLWVGTLDRGVLYYHPARFRFQNIGRALFNLSPQTELQVTGFRETLKHGLLVETSAGLYAYDPDAEAPLRRMGEVKAEAPRLLPDSMGQGLRILQSAGLGQDSVVGITRHGWYVYDRRTDRYTYTYSLHPCNAIAVDRRHDVWIGLEDGLLQWRPSNGYCRTYYTADGLVNNAIRSVVAAPDGALWVATANGLSCLTFGTGQRPDTVPTFTNFTQRDGLLADEYSMRAAYVASDSVLYWGGIGGFNRLIPFQAEVEPLNEAPLLVGFNLFGRAVETGRTYDGRLLLPQALSLTKQITLAHDQNFFGLEFSALNYVNPMQTTYRFQLEGVDKEMQTVRTIDGRGYASYTDVPPGTYLFRVEASGDGQTWTAPCAELLITIEAPFWQTPFAYLCYALVIAALLGLGCWEYLRRKRRSLLHEQKEKLDEMKTVFLRNINHELEIPVDHMSQGLDLVLHGLPDGPVRKRLQKVQQETADLKALVEQLGEGVLLPLPADEHADLEALLDNMRRLIEEQARRKAQLADNPDQDDGQMLSSSDETFLRKAIATIERNLDNTTYSVETLSSDLGMDRTGLYRKLQTLVGKTPGGFIRSVRLQRAARLLEEGYMVAEVADMVGFGSASYLSKCFLEEFGMRPSQYLAAHKKD